MPKRSRKSKEAKTSKRRDVTPTAHVTIERLEKLTEKPRAKNPAAVALGREGGLKGGPARMKSLTPEQRSTLARKAARARWKK